TASCHRRTRWCGSAVAASGGLGPAMARAEDKHHPRASEDVDNLRCKPVDCPQLEGQRTKVLSPRSSCYQQDDQKKGRHLGGFFYGVMRPWPFGAPESCSRGQLSSAPRSHIVQGQESSRTQAVLAAGAVRSMP